MATGIDDFATQMGELKERSGRSYGMLASRLHVSTSTLHRYCNGAAVPGDYAPVERFARLCGATPEELLALHRRWLLADAAKRGEPGRTSAVPATVPLTPTAVPAAAPTAPVTVPASDGGEPPPQHRPHRPHPRRRRTVALLAAAAALAVVATAAVVVLHAQQGGKRPAAAAGQHPPAAPAPLKVSVLSDNWDTACGQWFLLPKQPGSVPSPPPLQETNGWAAALGGTPAGHLRLQLTAQGSPGSPVVLHALYVKVLGSRPASRGAVYTPESGCGGGLTPAAFDVDLDAPAPRAAPVPPAKGYEGPPAADFPFQVSATDSEVLNVDAHTEDRNVTWYLDILWSCGDRHGTLRVDDRGEPFRTVGLKGDPGYFYSGTAWKPTPVTN